LPVAVVVVLGATPLEVGALQALEWGVIPLVALVAGVVVDRFPRRRMMIAAQSVRACALISLPLAYMLHTLTLGQFFIVTFVVGIATALFDTASIAFFRVLVPHDALSDGTTKLSVAASSAEVAGASVAGIAIAVVGGPTTIALDAVGALIATVCLGRIRCAEAMPTRTFATFAAVRAEIADGARVLFNDPVLRSIALTNATSHFGGAIVTSVFAIVVYRQLHLPALTVGVILGCANVGIGGAFFAARIARRCGMRRTLTLAIAAAGCANLLLPLAAPSWPIATLVLTRLILTLCGPIFAVNEQVVRVSIVPAELIGRVSATNRSIVWGMLPLGALVGADLGTTVGLAPTMVIGGMISLLAAAWMRGCPLIDAGRVEHRLRLGRTVKNINYAGAPLA
jgi:MFS family permease